MLIRGNWATTIENKEAMVRAKAFPKPPYSAGPEVKPGKGNTYLRITNKDVRKVLFGQSVKKILGPIKFNIKAIRLL